MKQMLVCLLLATALATGAFAAVAAANAEPAKSPQYRPGAFGKGSVVATVTGTVKRVLQPADAGKAVWFTLETKEDFVRVVLARAVVLKFKELTVKEGDTVSVTGWQTFDDQGQQPGNIVCAQITIDGKDYTLLTPDGKKTWTEYDVTPLLTLEGTIKNLVMPEPETAQPAADVKPADPTKPAADVKPADPAKPAADVKPTDPAKPADTVKHVETPRPAKKKSDIVSFTLVTDKDAYKVVVGPTSDVKNMGMTLTEGAKIKVTGWQFNPEQPIKAKEIALGDKTYTLCDKYGKWLIQAAPTPVAVPGATPAPAPAATLAPAK